MPLSAKVLTNALANCSAQEVLEQNTEDQGLGGDSQQETGQLKPVVSIQCLILVQPSLKLPSCLRLIAGITDLRQTLSY